MARHKCRDCGAGKAMECGLCHDHFCGKHKRIHYDLAHTGKSRQMGQKVNGGNNNAGYTTAALPPSSVHNGRRPHRDSL